jgi:pantothenate kinase-related protein Tda10
MPEIVDDKSQHCIPFLLERLRIHTERHANADGNTPPFFLGLNGVQGAGKTVLVSCSDLDWSSCLGTDSVPLLLGSTQLY